jgi:hypothetical protein
MDISANGMPDDLHQVYKLIFVISKNRIGLKNTQLVFCFKFEKKRTDITFVPLKNTLREYCRKKKTICRYP